MGKTLIFMVTLIMTLSHTAQSQTIEARNHALVENLFSRMNPDIPENSYLPEMAKEKLRWILRENNAKPSRLVINPSDRWTNAGDNVIASSINEPGQLPTIRLSASAIGSYVGKITDDQLKDVFLLSMVHEAIHLEKPLLQSASKEQKFQEEVRAWNRWLIGAVRPMLSRGRQLLVPWVLAEGVLRGCHDDPSCVSFQEIVRVHTP